MPALPTPPAELPAMPALPDVGLDGVHASARASLAYLPEIPTEFPPYNVFLPAGYVPTVDFSALPSVGSPKLAVPQTPKEAAAWVRATGNASAQASAHAAADAAELAAEAAESLAAGGRRALRRATGLAANATQLPLRFPRVVGPAQALREATFFPLSGVSLDALLARRAWTHVHPNGAAWQRAVRDATRGREVAFDTADGRTVHALWCPRAHDADLKEREFQRLVAGSSSSSSSGSPIGGSGLGSLGTGGVELPPEAAVILFHANAMVFNRGKFLTNSLRTY
jgi:hypothetical protein